MLAVGSGAGHKLHMVVDNEANLDCKYPGEYSIDRIAEEEGCNLCCDGIIISGYTEDPVPSGKGGSSGGGGGGGFRGKRVGLLGCYCGQSMYRHCLKSWGGMLATCASRWGLEWSSELNDLQERWCHKRLHMKNYSYPFIVCLTSDSLSFYIHVKSITFMSPTSDVCLGFNDNETLFLLVVKIAGTVI